MIWGGSPHHPDWLLPRWVAPVPPAMIAAPWPAPGVKNPVQSQRWLSDLWQMWRVHGIFPPEKKIRFPKMGELCSLSRVSRFCFLWKRGRTALSGPRSSGHCHLPGAADTAVLSPMEAGKSRSQNRLLESWKFPTRETKKKKCYRKSRKA